MGFPQKIEVTQSLFLGQSQRKSSLRLIHGVSVFMIILIPGLRSKVPTNVEALLQEIQHLAAFGKLLLQAGKIPKDLLSSQMKAKIKCIQLTSLSGV